MTATEWARRAGCLQAIVELAINHLEGRSYISPETLLQAARRALECDGSEGWRMFPEPTPIAPLVTVYPED